MFTAGQALRHGYTRDEIRARLASGRWLRVRRGIYRGAGEVDPYLVQVAAAVLACTLGQRGGEPLERRAPARSPAARGTERRRAHRPAAGHDHLRQGVRRAPWAAGRAGRRRSAGSRRRRSYARSSTSRGTDLSPRASPPRTMRCGAASRQYSSPTRCTGSAARPASRRCDAWWSSPTGGQSRSASPSRASPSPSTVSRRRSWGSPCHASGRLLGIVDFLWPDLGTAVEFDGRLKYAPDNDRGDRASLAREAARGRHPRQRPGGRTGDVGRDHAAASGSRGSDPSGVRSGETATQLPRDGENWPVYRATNVHTGQGGGEREAVRGSGEGGAGGAEVGAGLDDAGGHAGLGGLAVRRGGRTASCCRRRRPP